MSIIPNFKRDAIILAVCMITSMLVGCLPPASAQDQNEKGVYLGTAGGRNMYRYDDTVRGDRCYIIHSLNNSSISCVHP